MKIEEDVRIGEHAPAIRTKLMQYDVLILDARLRQSLVALRSLGEQGLRVGVLETADGLQTPAFSSRWCQQSIRCPAKEGSEEYLMRLEQALDLVRPRVLISSSDGTIALIRQYRERLEQRVAIALAKEPALGIAINKEQTLEVARMLGVAIPRGVRVSTVSEVRGALREIGLPAVVKPIESWVEHNQQGARYISQLVTTVDEAQRAVEALTHSGGTSLFQQFLSGRRESVNFLYAHSRVYARFAQWARRTYPPLGGLSVLRQSIAIPEDIGKQAEDLVREIGLEGYSEVEFRRDDKGVPYLMEINPRLSASIELAVRAGVDFPRLLYQWASGEAIDVVHGYQIGNWMRYLGGDILTTIAALQEYGRPGVPSPSRAILDFWLSFFLPTGYDYVDWRDPLPALSATTCFTRHLLRLTKAHLLSGRKKV